MPAEFSSETHGSTDQLTGVDEWPSACPSLEFKLTYNVSTLSELLRRHSYAT
jgi:hypothetical protein